MKNDKYWIASRGGVGKSTIQKELKDRGYQAIDGDSFEGLSAWVSLASGKKVEVNNPDLVDNSVVDWCWDSRKLNEILSIPGELFLCGSAANDLEFFNRFSRVFALTLEPQIHLTRLQTRADRYGKAAQKQQEILDWQKQFVEDALALGATAIDASQPVQNIVDEILTLVHES